MRFVLLSGFEAAFPLFLPTTQAPNHMPGDAGVRWKKDVSHLQLRTLGILPNRSN